MEILTDIALRAHWFRSHEKAYHVSKDTMLTPAARDFIREHGITLIYEDSAWKDSRKLKFPLYRNQLRQ